jgi:hypothetical protein
MTADEKTETDAGPRGLRGWLILIGIGVVLAPFILSIGLYQYYVPILQSAEYQDLFNPSSDSYVAWFWEFLLFEAGFNFGLLVAALFNLYGYFTCKSWFPKLYQVVLIGSVIFLVGDAWVSGLFFPDNPDAGFGDKAVARDIGRSIGQALIWVPYMQVSKRVRNTFVN